MIMTDGKKTDKTYVPNQKITHIIFAKAPDSKKYYTCCNDPSSDRHCGISDFAEDRGLGPRLQVVKKVESGLVHGLLYKK
jgi:hypothetical protein